MGDDLRNGSQDDSCPGIFELSIVFTSFEHGAWLQVLFIDSIQAMAVAQGIARTQ